MRAQTETELARCAPASDRHRVRYLNQEACWLASKNQAMRQHFDNSADAVGTDVVRSTALLKHRNNGYGNKSGN